MISEENLPTCWWCGAEADSREHRIKASQLRRMFKTADHLVLGGKTGERGTRINGVKSKAVLFPKVLCANCNNARSKPFDEAYDRFVQKAWDDPEHFRTRTEFDMAAIFPDDPDCGGAKLARYYIKNIACRIAEAGFLVPQQLVEFMDGAPAMPNGVLVLYKDFSNYDQFRRAGSDGHYPYANRMFSNEPHEGPLRAVCAEVQDGPVGAIFWWDSATELGTTFCLKNQTFLRDRRELPYPELHEEEWNRAELMRRAQDQAGVPPYPQPRS